MIFVAQNPTKPYLGPTGTIIINSEENSGDMTIQVVNPSLTLYDKIVLKEIFAEIDVYQTIANHPDNCLTPIHINVITSLRFILDNIASETILSPEILIFKTGNVDIKWNVKGNHVCVAIEPNIIVFTAWDDDCKDLFETIIIGADVTPDMNVAMEKLNEAITQIKTILR